MIEPSTEPVIGIIALQNLNSFMVLVSVTIVVVVFNLILVSLLDKHEKKKKS